MPVAQQECEIIAEEYVTYIQKVLNRTDGNGKRKMDTILDLCMAYMEKTLEKGGPNTQ